MKQIALIIIVILSVQNTCNIKKMKVIDIDEFIHSYKQGPFDEDFIKDFYTDVPDSNFYIGISYQTSTHFIGYSGLFMSRRFEEYHVFDSIAFILRNKSLLQSSLTDTAHCFMLNSESYDKLNDKSKIPIPDYDINFSLNRVINFDESICLGIRRESGFFFKKKFLKELNKDSELNDYISKVENGFSNGAIIDYKNRRIIYWTLIW